MQKNEKAIPNENVVLFDWLTFSTKIYDERSVLKFLGFDDQPFQKMERGRNGYRKRLFFENISILYDGAENMGVCVDMSGQGCRAFETYSTITWDQLFQELHSDPDSFNITRMDCAFDDHIGILDMDELRDDTDDHKYVSKSRQWDVNYGSEGTTIYHGSPRSNMYIRIYDKAAQQDLENVHWIRVELQMRDEIALGFLNGLYSTPLGVQFRGVLYNYLRYVRPAEDTNMSRWPLAGYWEKLLEGVERIRCWSAPGMDYDVWKLHNYIINQAGNALDCYLRIFTFEDLQRELGGRSIRRSPKYERLVKEYEEFKKRSGRDE